MNVVEGYGASSQVRSNGEAAVVGVPEEGAAGELEVPGELVAPGALEADGEAPACGVLLGIADAFEPGDGSEADALEEPGAKPTVVPPPQPAFSTSMAARDVSSNFLRTKSNLIT